MSVSRTMLRVIANTNVVEISQFIDQIEALIVFCTTRFGVDDPQIVELRESLRTLIFEYIEDLTDQQFLRYSTFYYHSASANKRWSIVKEIGRRNLIRAWNEYPI